MPESISIVDPQPESQWDLNLASFPNSDFFQTSAWANVLRQTYQHVPLYLCSGAKERPSAALPLMEVASPWTGRRGVCLPFTDYCGPLEHSPGAAIPLLAKSIELGRERGWKYLEIRSPVGEWSGACPSVTFYTHQLDLRLAPGELFKRFESSVRRGIRKAEKQGLQVRVETNPDAMRTFYRLHCQTRRKHGVPPQPYRFFQNIQRFVLDRGKGHLFIAFQGQIPAAASVFFHHARQAIYKFGASDSRMLSARPNNLVMWAALQHCAARGVETVHLGRTSLLNEGLRRFKLGFGAVESRLNYLRFDFKANQFVPIRDRSADWPNAIFRLAPGWMLRLTGKALYPHLS